MDVGVALDTLRPPFSSVRVGVRATTRDSLIVVGLTVLAAVLRFTRIGSQSFWYDESFTVLLVRHSPSQMLGLLPRTELTPPLYYLLAWPWTRIFGYGEVGLRSLSALAGVATIPAVYAAAANLVSRRAGLIAAALAACNPLLVWYSQEARSYALLVLFATLSLLAFAHARLPQPTSRRLVVWGLAAALTIATHYYGVLVVAPEAAWLVWILLQRDVFLMPLALDVPRLQFIKPQGARVRELDLIAIKDPKGGWFCWWGSACNLLPSELDTSIHVRGFHRYGRVLHVNQFSILRLRSTRPVRLTPAEITRALARAPLRAGQPPPANLPPGFGPPYGYGLLAQPPG